MKKRTIKVNRYGGCVAEANLGVQPPFCYDDGAESVENAIRSIYPNASARVVQGIFDGLKEYCPKNAPALMERMEMLAVVNVLADQLGGSWEACDE